MPKFRLSGMKLDEVSLVRSGDNTQAKVVIAKAAPIDDMLDEGDLAEIEKVKSSAYPGLDKKPGKSNWVDHAGGLPSYIERIAKHLHYEQGMSIGHAIAAAVNQVKKWAAGGKNVNPDTRAKAAKAVAEWEAKKAKGKVKKNDEEVSKRKKGMCECGVAYDSPQHAKKHQEWEAKVAKGRVNKETSEDDLENQSDQTDDQSEDEDGTTSTVGDESSDSQEEEVPDEVQKDDLPAVVRQYIEALEAKVSDLTKASKKEDDPLKVALAKADPTIRSIIEKQQQQIEEAQAIAKAERDARLEREFLAKAENLRMISEAPSELAGTLRKLHDLDPKVAGEVEKMLQTANTQIAKGNLFAEFGKGGAETTISKSVEGRAEQLMKADPSLTKEQAIAQAYANDPTLYELELKEG